MDPTSSKNNIFFTKSSEEDKKENTQEEKVQEAVSGYFEPVGGDPAELDDMPFLTSNSPEKKRKNPTEKKVENTSSKNLNANNNNFTQDNDKIDFSKLPTLTMEKIDWSKVRVVGEDEYSDKFSIFPTLADFNREDLEQLPKSNLQDLKNSLNFCDGHVHLLFSSIIDKLDENKDEIKLEVSITGVNPLEIYIDTYDPDHDLSVLPKVADRGFSEIHNDLFDVIKDTHLLLYVDLDLEKNRFVYTVKYKL